MRIKINFFIIFVYKKIEILIICYTYNKNKTITSALLYKTEMTSKLPQIVVASSPRPKTSEIGGQRTKKPQKVVASLSSKTDEEKDDMPKFKKISDDISKRIQQGRTRLGLTQKQLAEKVSLLTNVIADYETGKAIHNRAEIQKILSVLESNAK